MLVRRDAEGFTAADWAQVEPDFGAEHFFALDARASANPGSFR
ncbi:hypothetical protein [Streptomyces nigrescens]|uniref:Uncharacterized protein n=1 Tax=Streptomyces nigrescens TaxID=1920 RepID=A0ABY7JEW2_STRNI|nr:hypothetical protein [Streptomyces nigrescens]WAU09930.1 hypothetical protein STRNI_001984 [Streptomyces nigrescens]